MLGHAAVLADGIVRLIKALDHREQPEHHALIRHAVEVIQLRRQAAAVNGARLALAQVALIAALPEDDLLVRPARALHEAVALVIAASSAVPRRGGQTGADGKHPLFAEGVVEERRVVPADAGVHRLAKVHAIRADRHLRHVALRRAEVVEHLVALIRVVRLLIEPDAGAVALPAGLRHKDAVGAHLIVQLLAHEVPAILRYGQTRAVKPAGMVVEPVNAVGRIIPAAVGERRGNRRDAPVPLHRRLRRKHGLLHERRLMKALFKPALLDEEVVDEELAAQIDGHNIRALLHVGNGHLAHAHVIHIPRRPCVRQDDTVVQLFHVIFLSHALR